MVDACIAQRSFIKIVLTQALIVFQFCQFLHPVRLAEFYELCKFNAFAVEYL